MIQDSVAEAFNSQINKEFYSFYLYLAMATHLQGRGLKGLSALMRQKAAEEQTHAMKLFDFVEARGGAVILAAIDAPPAGWDSVLAAAEAAYAHECLISRSIDDLVAGCRAANDNAGETFLQWFVTEQVEEEETAQELVDQLRLIGDNGAALYMLDRDLGAGVAAPAPAAT